MDLAAGVDFTRYKRIVQYFWDPEPRNDDASKSPIWCLGQQYSVTAPKPEISFRRSSSQPGALPENSEANELLTPIGSASSSTDEGLAYGESTNVFGDDAGWPLLFLEDFESRIWLTYRSNFPPITKSSDPSSLSAMTFSVRLRSQLVEQGGFTSDAGWGCMIRSGQSLLANALVVLQLGREWRRGQQEDAERNLLSLFADDPQAPFSIHKFVEHGASKCGKHPGEWFGPSATARCIQALSNGRESTGLRVHMTGDGSDVYEDSVLKVAMPDGITFIPTLVLVGIRLGIDRVTPVYWEALKASLQMPQSVGIAGGRPSSSHYFVGVQGSYFFYLDPHHTRPALPFHALASEYSAEDIDSCHTRRLRRLHIKDMDPSMLLGFLIRDEGEWKTWKKGVAEVQGKAIIHVTDTEPSVPGKWVVREAAVDEVESFDDDDDDMTIGSAT
ncbi:MAG: Cysteine protease atg4 [Trizodia sp. TS-e1964]|nr:MAG: Cysteine protease atg4 [Trizodia sp. TS-e1964]